MMNTYASQHPADKTPLYESVHATGGWNPLLKRVLLGKFCIELLLYFQAFRKDASPTAPQRKRIAVAHVLQ